MFCAVKMLPAATKDHVQIRNVWLILRRKQLKFNDIRKINLTSRSRAFSASPRFSPGRDWLAIQLSKDAAK